MRLYKVGSTAADTVANLGVGGFAISVIKNGTVKGVFVNISGFGAAAKDLAYVALATNAVNAFRSGSQAMPQSFAEVCVQDSGTTGVGTGRSVWIPCDYRVEAGQQFVLNFSGTSTFTISYCEVLVWVSE